jgi:formylglycine-generating enzyme
MKLRLLPILFLPLAAAHADTFGSGANTFTMNFVDIGNAGNADDDTGYGGVGYAYRMGVNEVSERMIDAYNALSGGPSITKDTRGLDRPATNVSWNEAARFVNWLNTSKGYSVAYKFTTGGANDDIALWTISDAGYNAANPFRNANAYYFLPSEDEWYKAAYYDPNKSGGAGYWDYATGSDSAPTAVASGTTSGTAVYNGQPGPADITNAGGLSPYGTMAQNGNVWELGESGFAAAPGTPTPASSRRRSAPSPAPRSRTATWGFASQLFLNRLHS